MVCRSVFVVLVARSRLLLQLNARYSICVGDFSGWAMQTEGMLQRRGQAELGCNHLLAPEFRGNQL